MMTGKQDRETQVSSDDTLTTCDNDEFKTVTDTLWVTMRIACHRARPPLNASVLGSSKRDVCTRSISGLFGNITQHGELG